MTSKAVTITSSHQFKTIVGSSTYVVVDFWADWCAPCKVIAPVFEQLATQESKPGRLTFVKVNVDSQRDIASTYGISAMPTFLVLKGTKVVETVRGANAGALRSAVLSVAAEAARGPAKQSAQFAGQGHTLGGTGATRKPQLGAPDLSIAQMLSGPAALAQKPGLVPAVVRFLGLYITTLLSFDPMKTAEESPFAVKRSNIKTR